MNLYCFVRNDAIDKTDRLGLIPTLVLGYLSDPTSIEPERRPERAKPLQIDPISGRELVPGSPAEGDWLPAMVRVFVVPKGGCCLAAVIQLSEFKFHVYLGSFNENNEWVDEHGTIHSLAGIVAHEHLHFLAYQRRVEAVAEELRREWPTCFESHKFAEIAARALWERYTIRLYDERDREMNHEQNGYGTPRNRTPYPPFTPQTGNEAPPKAIPVPWLNF